MRHADPSARPAAETLQPAQRQPAAVPAATSTPASPGRADPEQRPAVPSIAHSPRLAAQRREWQGTFGGAAQLVASPAAVPVVQRNEESKVLLTKLAKPQVFEGPTFDVQTAIVESLEKALAPSLEKAEKQKEMGLWAQTNLGGIVLSSTPGDLEELISNSVLMDLEGDKLKIGKNVFDLVPEETRKLIVRNTLATMETASQLDYLRKSGLINDEWKVIVEVHYYRDRSTSQLALHKDTAGQTLFVNLNFQNNEEIAGPEFIVNPNMGQSYVDHRRTRLPGVFNDDLESANTAHGEPNEIGMSRVPKGGVVAFVDEAIHHKTPTLGHRKTNAGWIRLLLGKMHGEEFKRATEQFDKFNNRSKFFFGNYTFDTYLKNEDTHVMTPDGWYALLTKLQETGVEFDRTELAGQLPKDHKLGETFVDACIEASGVGHFGQATFHFANKKETGVARDDWEHVPVKKQGKPPLKRQMSQSLLDGHAPKGAVGRRTFFRTWVRAVKK